MEMLLNMGDGYKLGEKMIFSLGEEEISFPHLVFFSFNNISRCPALIFMFSNITHIEERERGKGEMGKKAENLKSGRKRRCVVWEEEWGEKICQMKMSSKQQTSSMFARSRARLSCSSVSSFFERFFFFVDEEEEFCCDFLLFRRGAACWAAATGGGAARRTNPRDELGITAP
jgi:hypothetical protein